MAPKFGRNYLLNVTTLNLSAPPLSIIPPFTVEFDIQRNYLKSANRANIKIYNLSETHRNSIRKDVIAFDLNRLVSFIAGYGQQLSTIFLGNVSKCWSYRRGVDFITEIDCYDGGIAFTNANFSDQLSGNFQSGTPISQIIGSMIGYLKTFGVSKGVVGTFPGTTIRGTSLVGSITDQINDFATNCFFIDNMKANCINFDEGLIGELTEISVDTGLLGTPIRQNALISLDMLFEPRFKTGQIINLTSLSNTSFNGQYKVIALNHRGMISEAVCGDVITSVELQQAPKTAFKAVG